MQSVDVRLQTSNISRELSAMREWLDRRGFEPSLFRHNCDRFGSSAVVHVSFKFAQEASEFAYEFGGAIVTPAS